MQTFLVFKNRWKLTMPSQSLCVCEEFLSSSSLILDLFTFPVAYYLETGQVENY